MSFIPTEAELFYKRNDPKDPRLGEIFQPVGLSSQASFSNLSASDLVLAGYPDDEGVKLSNGRPGASLGPKEIRRNFFRMTSPLDGEIAYNLLDGGNLRIEDFLERRHEKARKTATQVLKTGARWVTLGGGHDYGFSDGAAFLDVYKSGTKRPLVINFDAHFDVHSLDRGPTSGTPFFRLLEEFGGSFDFIEIGVQAQCASQHHSHYVTEKGGRIITLDDILMSSHSLEGLVLQRLERELLTPRPTYISIDVDVFSSGVAPGCSQSFPLGLPVWDFFRLFHILLNRLDVRALGIYEVAPPLDNLSTVRLAGQILHKFLSVKPVLDK